MTDGRFREAETAIQMTGMGRKQPHYGFVAKVSHVQLTNRSPVCRVGV